MIKKISKQMTIADILAVDEFIANILMREGMHCVFCGAAFDETLEQAGMVHGISEERLDQIVAEINDFLSVLPEEFREGPEEDPDSGTEA